MRALSPQIQETNIQGEEWNENMFIHTKPKVTHRP